MGSSSRLYFLIRISETALKSNAVTLPATLSAPDNVPFVPVIVVNVVAPATLSVPDNVPLVPVIVDNVVAPTTLSAPDNVPPVLSNFVFVA